MDRQASCSTPLYNTSAIYRSLPTSGRRQGKRKKVTILGERPAAAAATATTNHATKETTNSILASTKGETVGSSDAENKQYLKFEFKYRSQSTDSKPATANVWRCKLHLQHLLSSPL